ncbi:MAG: universal stress protein A [Planctomycetota bacterium]|jgi:universal stress protein A
MIKLEKILHPTDFSENSTQALRYACALAGKFDSELHLLHAVIDPIVAVTPPISGFLPSDYYQQILKNAENNLATLSLKDLDEKTKVVRKAIEGTALIEIIRYARENDIDMIVMGTHGHTGLMHMIMGSVAENVVRKAPCPVLTLHADDYKFVMP